MLKKLFFIPVKLGASDANGKVADDVTVEKVADKVTTNGELAVEETNGSATKEGEKEEEEEEYSVVRWVISSMNTMLPNTGISIPL